jgi:predicted phage terminase large subunit-like protein
MTQLAAAADELLRRRRAKDSLEAWMRYRGAPHKPALHHKLLISELEMVERGDTRNLMVNMPPGGAKSTYGSVEFPAWYMGRNPEKLIIGTANTDELAEVFSRRVRNIVNTAEFERVFGHTLSDDKTGVGNWVTTANGEYFAAGVGAAIAGRRGDLGLLDDPVKSREDADSERSRERVWQWYVNDFLTRLKPDARKILIMCMTGDTRVLMADGSETLLRDIRPGNVVATNDGGQIGVARVLNWVNQGPDYVFTIRTTSGRIIRANKRHPFLVCRDRGPEWVRLKDLRPKDRLICVGEHGKASLAKLTAVNYRPSARGSACPTTQKTGGLAESDLHHTTMSRFVRHIFDTDTELALKNTKHCLPSKAGFAQFVGNPPHKKILDLERGFISALTTATTPIKSVDYYATTVMLQSDGSEPLKTWKQQHDTYDFIQDEIESITADDYEDVFDIQVEGTENFIANGCTASNTRWHEDDLGGRILEREKKLWKVISLPMEAQEDDPLGREPGDRLWPEYFTDEMVDLAKQDTRSWWALYQQQPTAEDGDYFKREWFLEYDTPPKGLKLYGASDFAVTEGGGDYTEHGIAGVDASSNLYILDWWRGQKAADHWIDRMADLVAKHQPMCWFGEAGPIRRSIEPFMMKRLSEREAFCRVEWLPSVADKEARARGVQAMMAMGKVFWPRFAGWKTEVQGQMMKFPAGKHDDSVDVMSLFGRGLKHINGGRGKMKPLNYPNLGLPGVR